MPQISPESLVEERVAQLETISERRNELLRQMYYMMRRRENVGSVFTLDDDDEDEDALHVFLNRFDLNANPETGTIANLVENELFAPSLSQHAPSPPPSKGKPDTEAPRRSRRSKSRVVEVVDPPTDVPMEIVYDPPSPSRRSTSTHAEELESDDLLATAPPEGLPSRAHSASLQPHDIQESDDELDLIGSPAPESVKTISRAESVIHIIHSSSGQVVEVEADVPDGDTLVPILPEEAIVPDIAPEEVVLEEEHVVPLQEETVVAVEPEADEAEFEAAQKSSEEDEMVVDEQPISPVDEVGDESIAVKEVLVVEEEQDTLDKEHTEEQQQPSQEDVKMGVSEEQIPQEEGSQVEEIPPPQQHPAFEDGGELTLPSSPVISATRSPQPYQPQLPITPVTAGPAQRPVIILGPSSPFPGLPTFDFDLIPPAEPSSPRTPISPVQPRHQFNPQYTLPPLKALPVEFNRKGKPTKQQRKREKEREKNAGSEKGDGRKDKDNKDDWVPMGLNKWGATVRTNPVWKKVSRASKCLSTREWGVAMSELRLMRTLDRVEALKDHGRWSFRQPKKQRGIGGLTKTHWDYLMDEMKWMRIDFREERKWKMALAYNLSTAVLEWHAAGSLAERVGRGICVLWKRSRVEIQETAMDMDVDEHELPVDGMNVDDDKPPPDPPKASLLMVDYGSDDEDEDEQDKDQQSVVDALETAALINDALDAVDRGELDEGIGLKNLEPKAEDVEDSSVLQNGENSMDVDTQELGQDDAMGEENEEEKPATVETAPIGLKATSSDPLLPSKSNSQSTVGDTEPSIPTTKTTSKSNMYAPLREHIAYSDELKLFLDLDDFDPVKAEPSSADLAVENLLPAPDLSTIFPDLQPLGLLDVMPVVTSGSVSEGKKRSEKRSDRDDPNKRVEDTTYTKLFPIGQFMHCKPTLLGPLQPSKRWKNGQWSSLDENAVAPECENPTGRISDDHASDLFDNKSSNSPSMNPSLYMLPPPPKDKDSRKRMVDHLWTASDDSLLKSLTDKYATNWPLISECFNASRLTISTDQRTPRDCRDRWAEKWAAEGRSGPHIKSQDPSSSAIAEGTPPPPPPPPSGQMTTRGIKRLASASVSGHGGVGSASGSEPKKRRRHLLIQDTIRKAAKKRADLALKVNANQRKPPAIHDTHGQYNKMPKLTPAELSRMKAEKETRDTLDLNIVRKRQEDLTRQQLLREQAVHRLQQQQQQQVNGTQRPAPPGQVVTQIRSQVNISQQQRIGTPMSAANRISPQQMHQVQQARAAQQQAAQQQAQVQAHAQALAQAQALAAQAQNALPNLNGNGSAMGNPHLSPQYAPRDATSSPAHASPPHSSATPSNAANSPGPPTALLQTPQVPGNAVPRQSIQSINMGGQQYYNVGSFTQEQIHVLRAQMMQAQGISQGSQNINGTFPPQT